MSIKLFRYIVPFSFGDVDIGEAIDKISGGEFNYLNSAIRYKWEPVCCEDLTNGDSDLLEFFVDYFDSENSNSLGKVFKLTNKGASCIISCNKKLKTKKEGEKKEEKSCSFCIENIRLFVFRTGIGFLCYDATVTSNLSDEDAEKFQYEFKEISHSSNKIAIILSESESTNVSLAELLTSIINSTGLPGVHYHPERASTKLGKKPDKALLYTCIVSEDKSACEQSVRIICGYKESYKMIEDISHVNTFLNISWYTVKEGSGVIAYSDESNERFINNGFVNKVKYEYFLIYLFTLYQSYSTNLLSAQIANLLPSDARSFSDEGTMEAVSDVLEGIEHKINVFLLKSTFSTVSYVQPHNTYYDLCKKALRIDEDIKCLSDGVAPLNKMQRIRKEEREKKIQEKQGKINDIIGIVIAFFGLFSVLTDGVAFFEGFLSMKPLSYVFAAFVFVVFVALFILYIRLNKRR